MIVTIVREAQPNCSCLREGEHRSTIGARALRHPAAVSRFVLNACLRWVVHPLPVCSLATRLRTATLLQLRWLTLPIRVQATPSC